MFALYSYIAYNSHNMKNFNNIFDHEKRNSAREGDFKKRKSGGRDFRDRDRRRPQMYEAICSECGKRCEVPFKPTGDKPVYCSECFESHGGNQRQERGGRDRSRFQEKRMFDAVCDKCGKRFELPFKPTGEKPVYCNECFDKGGSSNEKRADQYKEQFDMLNAKLDMIIKTLSSSTKEEIETKSEIKSESKPKSKPKKKLVKVIKKKKAKK